MSEVTLVADATFSIGGAITGDPLLAAYEALTYVLVDGTTDLGTFGDEREVATIKLVAGGRVKKKPGTADAGQLELTVARDGADLGQIAMRAASKTKTAYGFKIEMADKPDGVGATPTTHYLKAYVVSAKNSLAGPDDFATTVFTLAIDAEPITVEADDGA